MNSQALSFNIVCMLAVSLISLVSSQLYRQEKKATSELMAFVSFAPGFLYALFAFPFVVTHVDTYIISALLVKNILYSLSFYFRYESLKKFGPFIGALMLGTQPIAIFFFGWVILNETVSIFKIYSLILITLALFILTFQKSSHSGSRISLGDFAKYFLMPTLASTLAIVWDRYFLKNEIPKAEFFVLDRIILIPALIITLMIYHRSVAKTSIWQPGSIQVMRRNWKLLFAIGLLFTVSVYSYNSALELENAAVVGLFRNSAYPLAAFCGAFLFARKTSLMEWISLALVVIAITLGVL